jgi:hypothetical protein
MSRKWHRPGMVMCWVQYDRKGEIVRAEYRPAGEAPNPIPTAPEQPARITRGIRAGSINPKQGSLI